MYTLQVEKEGLIKEVFTTTMGDQGQPCYYDEDERKFRLALGDRDSCKSLNLLPATNVESESLNVIQDDPRVHGFLDHDAIYHKCKDGGRFGRDLRLIAAGTQYNEDESWILRPQGPVLLDAAYMVSIVGGLYGRIDPERALRMLKRNLVPLG